MDEQTKRLLRRYAARYEKADFLEGDPSRFMHLATWTAGSGQARSSAT